MIEQEIKDLVQRWYATHTPEEIEEHFAAQRKAWVAAEMAFGDEGTREVHA